MPSFANADNAFMGIFDDVPNKVADAPEAAEQPKQEESPKQAELRSKESQEPSRQESATEPSYPDPAVHKRGRKKKGVADCNDKSSSEVGHFSCICNSKLIALVRAIAWKEHLTVRAVVESMFSKCIAKYEKKHGPIPTEHSRPADELF